MANGGMPSPILPDGTLLSMPIPSPKDDIQYSSIRYGDLSYFEIISSLKKNSSIRSDSTCHLDPDIRPGICPIAGNWIPAFGQTNAALKHLDNNGVGVGDLFLFFGWFRETEYSNGYLRFVKGAPDLHVIYGYLQVGDVIRAYQDIPYDLLSHPHAKAFRWEHDNALFIPCDKLSFMNDMNGYGCLSFRDDRVLTKSGCSRRIWQLPKFFKDIPITYNKNSWHGDDFFSAGRGQEFIFDANDDTLPWAKALIKP